MFLSEGSLTGLLPLTLHHGTPHELLSQVKLEADEKNQLFVERQNKKNHQKLSAAFFCRVGNSVQNMNCSFLICSSFVFNADASSQWLGPIQQKQLHVCNLTLAIDHKLRRCFGESAPIGRFFFARSGRSLSICEFRAFTQCDQSFQTKKAPNSFLPNST